MKTTIFYFHVVYHLEQLHLPQMQSVLAQFAEIMEGSQKAMKISNKTEWWKMRKGLDADLQVHSLILTLMLPLSRYAINNTLCWVFIVQTRLV